MEPLEKVDDTVDTDGNVVLDRWRRSYLDSIRKQRTCHFFLRSDAGVPDAWAHDMHLTGVERNAATGACDIEVMDTGRRGLGGGGDVPMN